MQGSNARILGKPLGVITQSIAKKGLFLVFLTGLGTCIKWPPRIEKVIYLFVEKAVKP